MSKPTRRDFLKKASLGSVVMVAVTACAPGVSAPETTEATSQTNTVANVDPNNLMVAFVRNADKGEIGILTGMQEIVIRDQDLVKRIVQAK